MIFTYDEDVIIRTLRHCSNRTTQPDVGGRGGEVNAPPPRDFTPWRYSRASQEGSVGAICSNRARTFINRVTGNALEDDT